MERNFQIRSVSIRQLVNQLTNGELIIPEHQRNFVWSELTKSLFIDSLLKTYPCPSLLIYEERGNPLSLEDGSQRLRTLQEYINDGFGASSEPKNPTIPKIKYSELTEIEKFKLETLHLPVIFYDTATQTERITIFDRFQNGSPLKIGERLHSLSYTQLIKFTIDTILTPSPLHDRLIEIWGDRLVRDPNPKKDARYDILTNAVAIIAGCAHGIKYISKKYEDIREIIALEIPPQTLEILNALITIYERAKELHPYTGKTIPNFQWVAGNFTGYIIYSLKKFPDEWDRLTIMWSNYLQKFYQEVGKTFIAETVHLNSPRTRTWNEERWQIGYDNVLNDRRAQAQSYEDSDSE
jgi:hypothetical protein